MATLDPCSAPNKCVSGTYDDGVLDGDVLFEVLLRCPPNAVCGHLRAVCRSWSWLALLSGALFAAEYASHRPGPLLVTGGPGHVVDLSGDVVRRLSGAEGAVALSVCDGLVCVAGTDHRLRVLDPVTGAVAPLPPNIWTELARVPGMLPSHDFSVSPFVFGRAASAGN